MTSSSSPLPTAHVLTITDEPYSRELGEGRTIEYPNLTCIQDEWENVSVHVVARLDGRMAGGMRLTPLAVGSNQIMTNQRYEPSFERGLAIERAWTVHERWTRPARGLYRILISLSIDLAIGAGHSCIACLASANSRNAALLFGFSQYSDIRGPLKVQIDNYGGTPQENTTVNAWIAEWEATTGMADYLAQKMESVRKLQKNLTLKVKVSDRAREKLA